METQKLTVRLPVDDIAYLKGYARHSGITVTEALHRYVYRLRELEREDIHPEVSHMAGLAPAKGSLNNNCRFWGVEAPVRQGAQRGAYSLYATLCATQPGGMDRRSKVGGYC